MSYAFMRYVLLTTLALSSCIPCAMAQNTSHTKNTDLESCQHSENIYFDFDEFIFSVPTALMHRRDIAGIYHSSGNVCPSQRDRATDYRSIYIESSNQPSARDIMLGLKLPYSIQITRNDIHLPKYPSGLEKIARFADGSYIADITAIETPPDVNSINKNVNLRTYLVRYGSHTKTLVKCSFNERNEAIAISAPSRLCLGFTRFKDVLYIKYKFYVLHSSENIIRHLPPGYAPEEPWDFIGFDRNVRAFLSSLVAG